MIETTDELYCDGGVISRNPSPYGGTWAWCRISNNNMISNDCGIIFPKNMKSLSVTNNQSELVAILKGLNSLPEEWIGTIKSDSQVTLGRIFLGWKWKNITPYLFQRYILIRNKFLYWEKINWILLDGHPNKKQLLEGVGANGNPVSQWNVWCDDTCREQSKLFKSLGVQIVST